MIIITKAPVFWFDILPALKDRDAHSRTAIPDRAKTYTTSPIHYGFIGSRLPNCGEFDLQPIQPAPSKNQRTVHVAVVVRAASSAAPNVFAQARQALRHASINVRALRP